MHLDLTLKYQFVSKSFDRSKVYWFSWACCLLSGIPQRKEFLAFAAKAAETLLSGP